MNLLPGLYVGCVALAFAALVRRWYDPFPGRIVGLFLLALLPLFGGALYGGKVLLPLDNLRGHSPFEALPKTEPSGNVLQGDLLQLVLPSQIAVRQAWAAGEWPLWNLRVGAGMPLLADPQTQAFQPLVLLGTPFPPAQAAGVVAALRVFCALAFFFLFARRQGLGEGSAVAGACAYGLGGFVLLWVGWPLANAAVWLPAVLWALARCDDEGGRRDGVLLTLTLLGLLFAGHPETILYALLLAGAFLVSRLLRRPRGLRGPLIRRSGLALAVALALAAPLLLPAAELLPRSLRSARLRATETLTAGPGFVAGLSRRLLPLAVPNAYGNDRFSAYWGLSNVNEDAAGFAGTATLLTLLASWAGLARGKRLPQERTALLILAFSLFVLSQPPGVARLVQLLPFGAGLGSRRVLLSLLACVAFLGASSLERFRRGEARLWPLLAATGALAGLVVWGTLAHGDPAQAATGIEVLRFGFLRWQLRFLVLAALVLVATLRLRSARAFAPWAVALCIAAELILAHAPANPPMPRELYLPQTDSLRTLRYQLGIRRLEGYRMAALGRALPPNLPALYELADVRIYNPMAPQAYVDLFRPIVTEWWGELPLLGAPAHPLYRRLGVRYLLTRPGRRVPTGLLPVDKLADGWIWEIPGALPLLSLGTLAPGGSAGGAPRPPANPAVEGSVQAPGDARLGGDGAGPARWGAARLGSLRPLRLEAQRVSAAARLAAPATLTTTLYQDGGWKLLANGEPLPTGLDLGVLLAAELPAGRTRLELLYRPASFLWGCLLAALGIAGALLAFVPAPQIPASERVRVDVERKRERS